MWPRLISSHILRCSPICTICPVQPGPFITLVPCKSCLKNSIPLGSSSSLNTPCIFSSSHTWAFDVQFHTVLGPASYNVVNRQGMSSSYFYQLRRHTRKLGNCSVCVLPHRSHQPQPSRSHQPLIGYPVGGFAWDFELSRAGVPLIGDSVHTSMKCSGVTLRSWAKDRKSVV